MRGTVNGLTESCLVAGRWAVVETLLTSLKSLLGWGLGPAVAVTTAFTNDGLGASGADRGRTK